MHRLHPHHHSKRTTTLITTHSITSTITPTPTPTLHAFTFPTLHFHANNPRTVLEKQEGGEEEDEECTCSHSYSISTRTLIRYVDRSKTSTTLVTRLSSPTIGAVGTKTNTDKKSKGAAGRLPSIQHDDEEVRRMKIDGVIRAMGVVPGIHHPPPSSHLTFVSTSTAIPSSHRYHKHAITVLTSTTLSPTNTQKITPSSKPIPTPSPNPPPRQSTYPLIFPPTFLYPYPPMIPPVPNYSLTPCTRSLSCLHPYQLSFPSFSMLETMQVYILLLSLVTGWVGSLVLCRRLTSFWAGSGCGIGCEKSQGVRNGRSRKPLDKPSKYTRHFEDGLFSTSTSTVGQPNPDATLPLHATSYKLNAKVVVRKMV